MSNASNKEIDPVYAYIGARLRELRRDQGIKQATLAARIGISPQQYYKYEDGQSKCSVTNLYKLAEIFGVELSAILPVSHGEYAGEKDNVRSFPAPKAKQVEQVNDAELLPRLITGFVSLPSADLKYKVLQLIEEMAKDS